MRAPAILVCLALAVTGAAVAAAPPVGPLPAGPVKTIQAKAGTTFRVTLPKSKPAGRVWRVARAYNGKVVTEAKEGETASSVWATYRALAPGRTTIVYALTRGETTHAYAARTFRVVVSR